MNHGYDPKRDSLKLQLYIYAPTCAIKKMPGRTVQRRVYRLPAAAMHWYHYTYRPISHLSLFPTYPPTSPPQPNSSAPSDMNNIEEGKLPIRPE